MHILLVSPGAPGTLARFLFSEDRLAAAAIGGNNSTAPARIAEQLLLRGHRVTVLTYSDIDRRIELTGGLLSIVQLPGRSRARDRALTWWRTERQSMVAEMVRASPDVVHAHWTYEHALAALSSGFPTVITVRDAPITVVRYIPNLYRAIRATLAYGVRFRQKKARFTAVSPYMARKWRTQVLSTQSVQVIPNLISRKRLTASEKSDVPTIIEVANAGKLKQVSSLLTAFRLVRAEVPTARLLLYGEGLDAQGEFAERAASLGLADAVEFHGTQPSGAIQTAMERAWVHAHASGEESFGNTVMEAMMAGTPVVAGSETGALPWLLDDGRAGILTDVRSPTDFAGAIIRLLSDQACRDAYVRAAFERASALCDPERVVSAYVREYEAAIRDARSTNVRG